MKTGKITSFLIICLLTLALAFSSVSAADGTVRFNGNKMTSDFNSDEIAKQFSELQPGNSVTVSVDFRNDSKISTDWYMLNDVIDTLEELNQERSTGGKDPKNGAYTYTLTYTSQGEGIPEVIFSNDSVGGDTKDTVPLKGLHQATDATGDYFFLTTLKPGQGGKVSLSIKLDGETDNNSYMDTDAKVKISFAVEKTGSKGERTNNPKTGDSFNFLPLIALVAALILLAIVFFMGRDREEEEADNEN